MTNKIATQIKDVSDQFRGRAAVFNVVPAMEDYDGNKWDHVVVSTAPAITGTETYIFPSDPEGNIVDWCELEGSMRGCDSWSDALNNAGYSLEES